MVFVFVSNSGGDNSWIKDIHKILSKFKTTALLGEKLCIAKDDAEIILVPVSPKTQIKCSAPSVFICDSRSNDKYILPNGCIAISIDNHHERLITNGSQQIISCGLGKKDTITASR